MRYRVLSRGKAKHLSIPEKPAEKTASLKAADLDNPYGRVFGTPRSREDLRKYARTPSPALPEGAFFVYRPTSRCVSCKKKRAGVEGVTFWG